MFCWHAYNLIDQSRRPQQPGFTAARSAIDAILALRLLSELHHEFNRPVNVEFVDVKSAFDSFDCTALWKALRSKGMPDIILHLITALHENTGARIRVGQKMSPRIFTTFGVREGCILAPILFCVSIDWIIQPAHALQRRVTVGSSTFIDLQRESKNKTLNSCP